MPTPALPPPPDGRFLIAFDDPMGAWEPDWTRVDSHPNLVTSYSIDRGRQFELDRTDGGRATVEIADTDGILDPTNPGGPYYGRLEPLLQAMIGRRNPVTGEWHTRFRGWIEEYDYAFDPSQRVNRLTVSLVDIFEVLAAIDMQPDDFGHSRPVGVVSPDVVWFDNSDTVRARMERALGQATIGVDWYVLFSGNVSLFPTSYSPGENVLTALWDCADSEFPGIGNLYTDRRGRLCFHGRFAKFTPEDIALEAGPGRWEWTDWDTGDGTAVHLDPANCAHIRRFSFNRGLSKIINAASATPEWSNAKSGSGYGTDLTAAEVKGQFVKNQASINHRGYRSWSIQNLQTERGQPSGANSLKETKKFASYYLTNYLEPQNRVTEITFRSISTAAEGAAITWDLLSRIDVSDGVKVTIDSPGGGSFLLEPFFVEGVHEEARMLTPDMDDVTLSLDLSPRVYYADPMALA